MQQQEMNQCPARRASRPAGLRQRRREDRQRRGDLLRLRDADARVGRDRNRLLSTKRVLVPVEGAQVTDDGLMVAYSKDHVKDGPDVDEDEISSGREAELAAHYGLGGADRQRDATGGRRGPVRDAFGGGDRGRHSSDGGRHRAAAQVGRDGACLARRRAAARGRAGHARAHRRAGRRPRVHRGAGRSSAARRETGRPEAGRGEGARSGCRRTCRPSGRRSRTK